MIWIIAAMAPFAVFGAATLFILFMGRGEAHCGRCGASSGTCPHYRNTEIQTVERAVDDGGSER